MKNYETIYENNVNLIANNSIIQHGNNNTIWYVSEYLNLYEFESNGELYYIAHPFGYVYASKKGLELKGMNSIEELNGFYPAYFSNDYQPCGTLSIKKMFQLYQQAKTKPLVVRWEHKNSNNEVELVEFTIRHINKLASY